MSFLKAQVSFPSNVASIFSAIKNNFPILFLAQSLYTLFKRRLSARVKLRQIPHVNFELKSQFLFKFCIILHCFTVMTQNSSVNFKLILFQLYTKGYHQGHNLDTLKCSVENLPNSSCQFLEAQVSSPSNFVSILSAIKHNSSLLF